jgi:Tup N-terminal
MDILGFLPRVDVDNTTIFSPNPTNGGGDKLRCCRQRQRFPGSVFTHHLYSPSQLMSVYNHRPVVPPAPSRIAELLDAIKGEFDQLTQDAITCRSQRDEYEHKSEHYTTTTFTLSVELHLITRY